MNRTNRVLLTLMTCTAMFALAGCGDSKQITEVKALPFSYPSDNVQDPNLTVDQALDHRKICASIKWQILTTEQHQIVIQYDCIYKGVKDSLFITRDKVMQQGSNLMYPDTIGDLYQWTYGADGQPELSYVALHYHFPNGTTKDIRSSGPIASDGGENFTGVSWVVMLMEEAIKENIENYDQFRSDVYGVSLPVKPASPITDTTYGNKLAELYPNDPPAQAAAEAIYWKGAPNASVSNFDKLGYPLLEQATDSRFLFPVDPADVQVAVKVNPDDVDNTAVSMPQTPEKLFCVNGTCYDSFNNLHFAVGTAPASVVARETAPSTTQATQPNAPASASTADPLPVGAEDWPASTPCIKKLEDAYRKDRKAQGFDDSISIDQDNEFASTCKTVGQ